MVEAMPAWKGKFQELFSRIEQLSTARENRK
jgi:hypothetical protein